MMQLKRHCVLAGLTAQPNALMMKVMLNVSLPETPRPPIQKPTKQRLRKLVKEGMVIPSVKAAIQDILNEEFVMPSDILEAIKTNKIAWENFQKFSLQYQRIRVAYVEGARNRPEEFKKRLNNFIKITEKNKQFGFGGIEKHY